MTGSGVDEAGEWAPDFPGQREPFRPGHELSMRHGARSERRIAPMADRILDELANDGSLPSYLADPTFAPALRSYARAEAVCELLTDHLAGLTVEQSTKGAMPLLEQLRRWTSTAQSLRRSLGLDPLSRANLERDVVATKATAADALRTHAEQGARVLAERGKRAADALSGPQNDEQAEAAR